MLVTWNERARPRWDRAAEPSRVTSSPAKRMTPASGARSPESCAISVVLPAPLGPMMASVSPSPTSRSTPSVATRPPKRLRKPRTSSSPSLMARARQQAPEAPSRVEDDQHQQRSQNHLPVRRPRGQHVLQQQEHERTQHGPEERAHAAEDDH